MTTVVIQPPDPVEQLWQPSSLAPGKSGWGVEERAIHQSPHYGHIHKNLCMSEPEKCIGVFLSLRSWAKPCLTVNLFSNLPPPKVMSTLIRKFGCFLIFNISLWVDYPAGAKGQGAFWMLSMIYEKLYGISWENRSQHWNNQKWPTSNNSLCDSEEGTPGSRWSIWQRINTPREGIQ